MILRNFACGFGQVFKAKYNLDGIKKIALDFRRKDYCDKLLKEVTLLSRMHHKNIVRYYQVWFKNSLYHAKKKEKNRHGSKMKKLKTNLLKEVREILKMPVKL